MTTDMTNTAPTDDCHKPAGAGPVQRMVRPLDVFCEADDALTYHERPFYAACAGRGHFERTPAWEQKRRELTRAWYAAHAVAWPPKPEPVRLPLHARLLAWLRPNEKAHLHEPAQGQTK